MISPAAFRLHSKGTALSAVRGRPGLVLDEYLADLTAADIDWLGDDPVFLAAELCAAGIWEPVAGGYRVLDAEAVQVCADRVRELRERDAASASGHGPGPLDRIDPCAVGAAGTTRFGELNRLGEAVFRCARCTRTAAIVYAVRADVAAEMGRPAGTEIIAEGLVLDRFLGTSWHAEPPGILDAVQALIQRGNVDPVAIGAISDDAVESNAVLLPGVPAELLRPVLGHLRPLHPWPPRLHHGHLPPWASAHCRLTGLSRRAV